MIYEVEQKFRVSNFAPLERILRELGGNFQPPISQVDTYFSHPSRDFTTTDEAFRIRRVGELNFVTYKGPKIERETKTRRELELPLPEGDDAVSHFAELFVVLGFSPVANVCKQRTYVVLDWEHQHVDVALDNVQEVGQFVELEIATDENQMEECKRSVKSLAKTLGLSNHERRSYLELLLEAK